MFTIRITYRQAKREDPMVTKANEKLLQETYQENLKKINPFFRLTKKSLITAGCVIAVILILLVVFIFVFIPFGSTDSLQNLDNMVHLWAYIIVAAIPVLAVVVWFLICRYLDGKAFREASEFALKHAQWEEERLKESHRDLQFEHIEQPAAVPVKSGKGRTCPECGAPMMPMESRCTVCGARYHD